MIAFGVAAEPVKKEQHRNNSPKINFLIFKNLYNTWFKSNYFFKYLQDEEGLSCLFQWQIVASEVCSYLEILQLLLI